MTGVNGRRFVVKFVSALAFREGVLIEYLLLLFLGLSMCVLGVLNIRGDVSSVHWYNRWRVSTTDLPAYGRIIGKGTLLIGLSVSCAAGGQMMYASDLWWYVLLAGLIIGVSIMIYGQFRYNHGFFEMWSQFWHGGNSRRSKIVEHSEADSVCRIENSASFSFDRYGRKVDPVAFKRSDI